jgi:hypothetical protein
MRAVLIALILAALTAVATAAWALDAPEHPPSADLAKKCRALTVKAHPPAVAGSKSGTAAAEREYFATCIKKGGKMDEESGGKPQ